MSQKLTLRGNKCQLSWNVGVPLTKVGSNTWTIDIICSRYDDDDNNILELKVLAGNDKVWMVGPNFRISISEHDNNNNNNIN